MKAKWSVNPDFKDLDRFCELSKDYDAAFEYIDFTYPSVYQNPDEVRKRIDAYKALARDRSRDTLHGVFFDVAFISMDDVIREHSRSLAEMSMRVAAELGCKGVVFHTGILGGLNLQTYLDGWVEGMCEYLPTLSAKFPELEIYIENTVESSPREICELAERLKSNGKIRLCLDYAHACVSHKNPADWVGPMAPYVAHMHLNDNDLNEDLHLAAGDGKIDFVLFKKYIEEYGLDTSILLEVSGYEKAKRSLEFMSAL